MENTVQLTQVSQAVQIIVNLDKARSALVSQVGKIGEVIQVYADGLSQAFDLVDNEGNVTTKWYDLQGTFTKPVKAERALFVTAMEAKGYEKPTINTYWARVKEAAGYVTAGNRATATLDTDAKTLSELKTILNRIFNDETDCKAQQVKGILIDAFVQMGGDAMKLGTNNKG
jgi:hypothetical protein